MKALHRLFTRLRNVTTQRRGEERLREEIESHIAAETAENIRAGMTAEEAYRRAHLKFGAVEAVRENYHEEESILFLEDLLHDARYAFACLKVTRLHVRRRRHLNGGDRRKHRSLRSAQRRPAAPTSGE